MFQTRPRLYLVEDDDSVRKAIERMLTLLDFHVTTFDSAEAFLESEYRSESGCLILDVHMPGMSGLDLQCKLNKLNPNLRIIMITGKHNEYDHEQALAGGACDFLYKPFDDKTLVNAVYRALERPS
ncbi:MAG: response regulator [Acidobacteriota bacterium]|nr:response regulator [Acidobacteriota bacterium]